MSSRDERAIAESLRNRFGADGPDGTNALLLTLLDSASDALLLADDQGKIVFGNARAHLLFGGAECGLLHRRIDELLPAADSPDADAAGPDTEEWESWTETRDGERAPVCVSRFPLESSGRTFTAYRLRDIRELKNVRDALLLSEARSAEAQRLAKIGHWDWNIETDEHWWSDEMYRMIGAEPEPGVSPIEQYEARIHPDDVERQRASRETALKTGSAPPTELRLVMPDGSEKVFQLRGQVRTDVEGRPVRMFGTMQDITERKQAETAVGRSEARLREAQRLAKVGNWEWDVVNEREWWSEGLYAILEEDPDTYAATFENFVRKVHPADRESLIQNKGDFSPGPGAREPQELRIVMRDGWVKTVVTQAEVRMDEDGRPLSVIGAVHDVTERKQAEKALRTSEERYSVTVELAAVGIAHVAPGGQFLDANRQLCEMLGYSKKELQRLTVKEISHPDDVDVTDEGRAKLHAGEIKSLKVEKRYVRKDGEVVWARVTTTVRRSPEGNPLYDISILEDISERKRAEARVEYLATHDEMTGLPNRVMFSEVLNHSIESARRTNQCCAVMFMDLDGFKDINDTLGHQAGDELLIEIARRLQGALRDSDFAARLGGDEFCVLLEDVGNSYAAAIVAKKCLEAIAKPLVIAGRELQPRISVGITLFPDDGEDREALLQNADSAMYAAKQAGSHRYAFYTPQLTIDAERRMTLEHDLRRSVQRGEFELYYQPQIALSTGRLVSLEALVRWRHPTRGMIGPNEFISVAENIGLIEDLGEWVLRSAGARILQWNGLASESIRVGVNISSLHFRSGRIVRSVAELLEDTGLDPGLLELEVTESALQTGDDAIETFNRLHDLGVRIAIDDFGTAYSWLDSLRRLPVDTLKIDKRFVNDLLDDSANSAIVATIMAMGRAMNLRVVAEGIETREQVQYLLAMGCDLAQGFYFSRPVPAEQVTGLLDRSFLPESTAEQIALPSTGP